MYCKNGAYFILIKLRFSQKQSICHAYDGDLASAELYRLVASRRCRDGRGKVSSSSSSRSRCPSLKWLAQAITRHRVRYIPAVRSSCQLTATSRGMTTPSDRRRQWRRRAVLVDRRPTQRRRPHASTYRRVASTSTRQQRV